jgi:hypothetical protein
MKSWISFAFGAAALATASFGAATPAAAGSDVGVYVGPGGAAISVSHREKCRDYWYRRNHPGRCGYGHVYRERYYGGNHRYNRCHDYWYRRNHPYQCGYRHHRRYHDW